MKWLIKLLCPSAETLAELAADGIAKSINESGRADTIAKYSMAMKKITANAAAINTMLLDGKIDEGENSQIREMLTPVFGEALALI